MKNWNAMLPGSLSRIMLFSAAVIVLLLFTCRIQAQNSNNNSNNNSNSNSNSNNNNDDSSSNLIAGARNWGYRSSVGGFSIDGQQAFRVADKQELTGLTQKMRQQLQSIPADLDQKTEVRKISLKRLSAQLKKEISDETKTEHRISDSLLYLGGLTAIDAVVAVPEENDIYLVGPAEGWTVSDSGAVVGKTSGKPILLLEDLLTVFRAAQRKADVISCSIDPTPEAVKRFSNMTVIPDPQQKRQANIEAMGMMNITFNGINSDCRMAEVLSAADYRMKRLSLGVEAMPVKGLSSYAKMIHKSSNSFAVRFWIQPEYSTLLHDADKLVWNIKETKVNVLTEREFVSANGSREVSGQKDIVAERWAKSMTKNYSSLSKTDPIFAEAKNCMDLALVAAVILSQNLMDRVGSSFDGLTDEKAAPLPSRIAPKAVPGDSLVKVTDNRGSYLSVTGGVLINPWETVKNNTQLKEDLANMKSAVAFAGNSWYAN